MSNEHKDRVILITGGGSGMGRLAAQNFVRAGAKVAALDVSDEGLAETAAGQDAISTWQVDITDYAALSEVVNQVEETVGPIDAVYNAAAIMPLGRLTEHDNATQHKIMDINYGGLINITQAALPRMLKRGKGDFVSFASSAGLLPTMLTGAYSASKAAVAFYKEIL